MESVPLPPINFATDIANNAMDERIAAGTLEPMMATAWSYSFWFDLLGQYFADGSSPQEFVSNYCADAAHASWCAGVVF